MLCVKRLSKRVLILLLCISLTTTSVFNYKAEASTLLLSIGGALLLSALATCGYFVTHDTYFDLEEELDDWWMGYAGANNITYSDLTKVGAYYLSVEEWQSIVDAAIEADEEAITAAIQDAVLAVIMYKLFEFEIPESINFYSSENDVFTFRCTAGFVRIDASQLVAGMDLTLGSFKIPVWVEDNNGVEWNFDYGFAALFIEMVREFADDCISKLGNYVSSFTSSNSVSSNSFLNKKSINNVSNSIYQTVYDDILNVYQFVLAQNVFGAENNLRVAEIKLALANWRNNITVDDLQLMLTDSSVEISDKYIVGLTYYGNSSFLFIRFLDDYSYYVYDNYLYGYSDEIPAGEQVRLNNRLFVSTDVGNYDFSLLNFSLSDYIAKFSAPADLGMFRDTYYDDKANFICGISYIFGVDEGTVYTSKSNYADGITWEDELEGKVVYGGGVPADIDLDKYLVDSDAYFELTEPLTDAGTDDEAAENIVVNVVAPDYSATLDNIVDAIVDSSASQVSWLQKIFNALLELPTSIVDGVSAGIGSIIGILGDIDAGVEESLPLIGDISSHVGLTYETIASAVTTDAEGNVAINVKVTEPSTEPEPYDSLNLGIFSILVYLMLILIQLFVIFFHLLEFISKLATTVAYPYFLNEDVIRGFEFMKSVNITGDLLNITLYDFMFVLLRIIFVFAIIKVLRTRIEKLRM